ncbi:CopM family metallochaperone [Aquamicrobium soli]|uniref:DUF305 domain-containing protein n=1 Tax=Aquamicrobium soli TaxID=1811518 RepID=A0ABV7KEC5_9HYPH
MRMTRKILLAPMAAVALLGAQLAGMPAQSAQMNHDMAAAATDDPAAGYQAAMDKMHRDMMAMQYTGNADADFVRAMIPHHQAAIDMAKVLLDHGKDPDLRKLAQNIITAQEKEITEMEDWLDAHPGK